METTIKKFDKKGIVTKEYVLANYPECFANWLSLIHI